MTAPPLDRASLYRVLKQKIVVRTLPPVALGLGHTSLEDKASALMFAIFLDVSYPRLQDPSGGLHRYRRLINFLRTFAILAKDPSRLSRYPAPLCFPFSFMPLLFAFGLSSGGSGRKSPKKLDELSAP